VSSDFGIPNRASTPKKPRCIGDLPDSPAYWADYARQARIKFYWSYIPSELAAYRKSFGQDTMLVPETLRDNSKVWHFSRYSSGSFYADTIDTILNRKNLDSLVSKKQFEVAYTHFGYWSDNSNRVNPELSLPSIDAFRLLKAYQDEGKILVTKTARLLRYNLALDYSDFTAKQLDQDVTIDITTIKDTQFGDFTPTLHDVRGLTFYVSDSSKAEITINGTKISDKETQRNPGDESGMQSIGVKWFEPDYTDYTTWTLADVNRRFAH
jgi:hypothetical protein